MSDASDVFWDLFLDWDGVKKITAASASASASPSLSCGIRLDQQFLHFQEDAPKCSICGMVVVRNGSCYRCYNCGSSLGCS
jgi:hypothetical protein